MTQEKILSECREMAQNAGLSEEQSDQFIRTVSDVLHDYSVFLGEDCEIQYRLRKRFGRAELVLRIPGERTDPFLLGEKARERLLHKQINSFRPGCETTLSYYYMNGLNTAIIRSPRKEESRNILKQPMVLSALFGLFAGLLSQFLPETAGSFLIEECASPILTLLLNILTGVTGPVVFLSIVLAIGSLESIDELNRLGTLVIRRFALVSSFITAAAILVSLLFFPILG